MAFLNWLETRSDVNIFIMQCIFIGTFFLLVPATIFKLLSSNEILYFVFQIICTLIFMCFLFIAMRKWMHSFDSDLD